MPFRASVGHPPVIRVKRAQSVAFAGQNIGLTIGAASPAIPAVFPLELIQPRAAGSTPGNGSDMPINPGMPSGHRIFKAYPGIPYNIRAAVLGGSYPFTHTLSNAPVGMTVDVRTGEINWPNPTGTTVTPTLIVTDAEGTQVSSSWTITITTSGFRFVDANASTNGSGTLASPWNALSSVHTSSTISDIVYFRAGTYTPAGISRSNVGGVWERIEFQPPRSSMWVAYPGETVIYDAQGGVGGTPIGAFPRLVGDITNPVYVDGITFLNHRNILLQLVSEGNLRWQTVRRCEFYNVYIGEDGSNGGAIMCMTDNSNVSPTYWSVFQDIYAHDNAPGALKMYGRFKCLMENIRNENCNVGPDVAKDNMTRWEVRGCTLRNNTGTGRDAGIYGSMNDPAYTGYPFDGEVRYNLVISNTGTDTWGCLINEFGRCARTDVYRNTFVNGHVGVTNLTGNGVYDDGPFYWYNNVIQSADTGDKITKWTSPFGGGVSTAPNVIVGSAGGAGKLDNLLGTSGIVDANGLLQGSFRTTYLGTHGHEVP